MHKKINLPSNSLVSVSAATNEKVCFCEKLNLSNKVALKNTKLKLFKAENIQLKNIHIKEEVAFQTSKLSFHKIFPPLKYIRRLN